MASRILYIAIVMILSHACGATSSPSQLKNVFGPDNRVPKPDGYPWSAIGKVITPEGECTGTLVWRNAVITASHCVVDSTGRLITNGIRFIANYNGTAKVFSAEVRQSSVGTMNPNAHRKEDWAILYLDSSLGNDLNYLPVQLTDIDNFPGQISIAGYSGNFMHGDTAGVHHNCNVRGRDVTEGVFFNDCDSGRGVSGGPALRMFNNQLTIVGLAVSERRNGGSDSLYLPEYDEQHANIVIPTASALRQVLFNYIDSDRATHPRQASAIAWNDAGGWVVRYRDTVEAAQSRALQDCNDLYGSCYSGGQYNDASRLCLAIASGAQNRLFSWVAQDPQQAVTSALTHCQTQGAASCQIQFSRCNDTF